MKSEGVFLVLLTHSERIALIDLLCEFLLDPNSTRAFVDCSNPRSKPVTPGDLLRILDRARWFGELSEAELINPEGLPRPHLKN
jgi:hypothetical protein